MNFVEIPNLPDKPVKLALVDGRISSEAEQSLTRLGVNLIKTGAYKGVHWAISFHPDIMFHHVGDNVIVYAPGTCESVLNKLSSLGFELVRGATPLTCRYPGDIAYNAARIGKYVFHNFKYTDRILKDILEKKGLEFINIKQGYTKCSISVVDERSIITSDPGIAKAAVKNNFDVLLIDQDEPIALPGFDKGFIGGCSGLIDKGLWAVNGKLEFLKSYRNIYRFLETKGIKPISLSNGVVCDIGTIIPLFTE